MTTDWSGGNASEAGLFVGGAMSVVVATVSDYGMRMKLSVTWGQRHDGYRIVNTSTVTRRVQDSQYVNSDRTTRGQSTPQL